MLTRQTIYIAFVIDICLLLGAAWLLNTDTADRGLQRAKGWASITRLCWRAARWIGAKAIDAELHYHREIEKAKP